MAGMEECGWEHIWGLLGMVGWELGGSSCSPGNLRGVPRGDGGESHRRRLHNKTLNRGAATMLGPADQACVLAGCSCGEALTC